ncbi:hypothetical protein Lal_00012564, partial [Lupinus albus]
MTRGNTCPLHPINPEIDRTYHMLVKQSRNLPFHSVADTDSVSVSVHSVQYTDFVHFVALSDSEHSVNSVLSENMAQPPTPSGPRERTLRDLPRNTDHPEAYAANIYNNRPKQQQQNYDPSSSRYNPDWRNHPNIKWSDHTQQQPPHVVTPRFRKSRLREKWLTWAVCMKCIVDHLCGVDLPEVVVEHLCDVDLPDEVMDHLCGVDLPKVVVELLCNVDLPDVVMDHLCGVDLPKVLVEYLCDVDLPDEVMDHLCGVDLPEVVVDHLCVVDLPDE